MVGRLVGHRRVAGQAERVGLAGRRGAEADDGHRGRAARSARGIATRSQSSRSVGSPPSTETWGSQSSSVVSSTRSRLALAATWSIRRSSSKSRSGRPLDSTSAHVVAVLAGGDQARRRSRRSAPASARPGRRRRRVSTRVCGDGLSGAGSRGRRPWTRRGRAGAVVADRDDRRRRPAGSRRRGSRRGRGCRAPRPRRRRRRTSSARPRAAAPAARPSVLTLSGSSTPASCTLVPVSDGLARRGAGEGAALPLPGVVEVAAAAPPAASVGIGRARVVESRSSWPSAAYS